MSNHTNEALLEEAQFYAIHFEGKLPAELIYNDIANNDLDTLRLHVKQARDLAFQEEYNPEEQHWVVGQNDVY